MIGQKFLLIFRLEMNDNKWKRIKRVCDRFETVSLEDWNFLTEWLVKREKMKLDLYMTHKVVYRDKDLDS